MADQWEPVRVPGTGRWLCRYERGDMPGVPFYCGTVKHSSREAALRHCAKMHNEATYARLDEGCLCEFRAGCGGLGTLVCQGCGGDLCICICGGETECFGCEDCDHGDDGEVAYG